MEESDGILVYRRADVFKKSRMPLDLIRQSQHPSIPLHRHEFSELVVILRGKGVHRTLTGDYPIGAGDVFVLHPQQAHGYHYTENLELVNVIFVLEDLALPVADLALLPGYHALFTPEPIRQAPDRYEARLRLSLDKLMEISWLLDRLEQELSRREEGGEFKSLAYFMLLLAGLSQCYAPMPEPPVRSHVQFGRVLSYMEQSYTEPISLEELAQVGCVSVRSLTRAFKETFGCSPIDYLIQMRIRYATELLSDFELSITEIALRCGFRDSNYFARKFRAVVGTTPRDFRKQQEALTRAFSQSHTLEHSSHVGGRFWDTDRS